MNDDGRDGVEPGVLVAIGLNLTLDRTLRLPHLGPGHVLRATDVAVTAGGKALNVCRAARTLGAECALVGPFAGELGRFALGLIAAEGIPCHHVAVEGEVRGTTVVLESDGRATVINEPGPELSAVAWHALRTAIAGAIGHGRFVAVSGSAPPGTPADADGQIIGIVRAASGFVAVDANGERLLAAAAAGADLVSPNLAEAESALGTARGAEATDAAGDDHDEIVERATRAAAALVAAGARSAMVSAGPHGVAWMGSQASGFVGAPSVGVVNPIGAGDTLLGATLVALAAGLALADAVRQGVAYAAASVAHPVAGCADPVMVAGLRAIVGPA
ncbi:1-phosphofructokinase family hexose kinase [Desertimonas flava]|uniref:1-phosphofructokinase family hexose kinase n=1 Tax=Desertimonas flava TaxID=2064846 RepID=UPI000E34170A|nr:PfkB family carbohydrate kinase [Desertimonas flava]